MLVALNSLTFPLNLMFTFLEGFKIRTRLHDFRVSFKRRWSSVDSQNIVDILIYYINCCQYKIHFSLIYKD